MQTIFVVIHLFVSLGLVGLILIQHGKGADAGAAFGSGASATVFGAQGSANFLSRTTAVLAAVFFLTSLTLGWFAMQTTEQKGVMEQIQSTQPAPRPQEVPLPSGAGPEADPTAEVPAIPE